MKTTLAPQRSWTACKGTLSLIRPLGNLGLLRPRSQKWELFSLTPNLRKTWYATSHTSPP